MKLMDDDDDKAKLCVCVCVWHTIVYLFIFLMKKPMWGSDVVWAFFFFEVMKAGMGEDVFFFLSQ